MVQKISSLVFVLFLLQAGRWAFAADKSRYHLFRPTPAAEMREFVTDRPDRTESPISVDAGHLQLETDLISFTRSQDQETLVINGMNLKVGLTNNSDLQIIVPTFLRRGDASGVGNLTVRYKINLFGNDQGSSGLAVMPYFTFPTQSRVLGVARSEAGVILPYSFDAPAGFSFGGMFQYDKLRNDLDNGFHSQLIASWAISRNVVNDIEAYFEFFSQTEVGSDWVATVDGGFIFPLNEALRSDVGANIGVTESAEDFTGFLGLSLRL